MNLKVVRELKLKIFWPYYYVFNAEEISYSLQETLRDQNLYFGKYDEMDSLNSNNTWKMVELPPDCATIGCNMFLGKIQT